MGEDGYERKAREEHSKAKRWKGKGKRMERKEKLKK